MDGLTLLLNWPQGADAVKLCTDGEACSVHCFPAALPVNMLDRHQAFQAQ